MIGSRATERHGVLAVGLMSGTSADGVDAALVRIDERAGRLVVETLAARTDAYDAAFRRRLLALPDVTSRELASLHVELGERLAASASAVIRRARVRCGAVAFVASHGHTAVHLPGRRGRGVTMQVGEPAVIAERTGLRVVADFRPADVAAGGEGAPLVPYVDRLLFARTGRVVACQNVGGIANVTALGPRPTDLVAFDTGPGMMAIDLAVAAATKGAKRFDSSGSIAASAHVDERLLSVLLAHRYLARRPPKSTGREEFGASFVAPLLARTRTSAARRDLVATLTAFTARSIADAYRRFLPRVDECVVSGGGAHNETLLSHLRAALPGVDVVTSAARGVDPDFKEAVAFAVLGWARLLGRPNTVPAATGARRAVIAGAVWSPHAGWGGNRLRRGANALE